MTLSLALLGKFALARNGQPIDLRSKKAQALLIYLALTGKPQSREHLATLLWGDRFDDQARRSLRQAVFALRKAVGPDVLVGDEELGLTREVLEVDALAGSTTQPLLPGFRVGEDTFDEWLTHERERRQQEAAAEFCNDAKALKDTGATDKALPLAQKALELEPLNESTLRLTMTLLAAEGRRAEALALFQRFSERLKAELDAEPDALTLSSYNILLQTVQSETRIELSGPGGQLGNFFVVPFEDLGGGDIATFLARELPLQVISDITPIGFLVARAPFDTKDFTDQVALIKRVTDAGGRGLITGSARQIRDRVRVSVRIIATDQQVVFTENEVVSVDEAFDFIDSASDRIRNGMLNYWHKIRLPDFAPTETLKPLVGQQEKFRTVFNDLWLSAFYTTNTRAHMVAMDEACDFALAHFPKDPTYLSAKAMVAHHAVQLSDRKDRIAAIEAAYEYVKRALALDPGLYSAQYVRMMMANSLGRFDEVRDAWNILSQPGTKTSALDGLLGVTQMFEGQYDEAIASIESSIAQETGYPSLVYRYAALGLTHFSKDDFEEALNAAESALEVSHEYWLSHLVKIAALQRLGRIDKAALAIGDFRENYRAPTVSEWNWLPFSDETPKKNFLDALRGAGLPE